MDSTFLKGLSVLEALAKSAEPCGVSDISRQLGLTKSNVHRSLQTLVAGGYVRNRGGAGRYELTLKLWELGVRVIGKLDVKKIAMEYMAHLAQVSGETVHLSILENEEVVYLEKVDSPQPVRAYSEVGGRAPAYCVATGKAMLAYAPAELIDAIALRLSPFTKHTIDSPAELKAELERVRNTGYAINKGEWREGVWGIAAPIRDAHDVVFAAIGISGPADRFKPSTVKRLAPLVAGVAKQISARLGATSGRQPEGLAD